MKRFRLLPGLLVVLMVFASSQAEAHRGHHVRHRVYTPYWIPAYMATMDVRHVYFPRHNIYFDRWNGTYLYRESRRWVTSRRLPSYLRRLNLARSYKVALDIHIARPFVYNRRHLAAYRQNRGARFYDDDRYENDDDRYERNRNRRYGRNSRNRERDD